jgi:hypothetical protein
MIENIYLLEMTIKSKVAEITRGVDVVRFAAPSRGEPSRARRAVASAIVRFGIFLNGSAYHCPQAACER